MQEGLLIALVFIAAIRGQSVAPSSSIDQSYIFMFNADTSNREASVSQFIDNDVIELLRGSTAAAKPFSAGSVRGFTAFKVSSDQLEKLVSRTEELGGNYHPNYITKLNVPRQGEPFTLNDSAVSLASVELVTASARCAARSLLLGGNSFDNLDLLDLHYGDSDYCAPTKQADVMDVFVMDTGIDASHSEFSHLSINRDDCGDGSIEPWTRYADLDGHGTHVAGIIASKSAGVTPNVVLHTIKVLGDDGSGAASSLLCGLTAVETWLSSNPSKKAVVNLSLTSTTKRLTSSEAAMKSIATTYKDRVVFVVAAGNARSGLSAPDDACKLSYSAVSEAVSVGSVSASLSESEFSDYGTCVDVMAVGEDVYSTLPNEQYGLKSGTSMAAPLVTGVIAQYWLEHPAKTGVDIRDSIGQQGSGDLHADGLLTVLNAGTPNKLIKYACPGGCCAAQSCLNGGTCLNDGGGGSCLCRAGYLGDRCQTVSVCASQPCLNGGDCAVSGTAYTCTCPAGTRGPRCELKDPCNGNPCQNGGSCHVHSNSFFTCSCPSGFTAANCDENIDECLSNPCLNGGTCSDQTNAYECTCARGHVGSDCNFSATCTSSPCRNGATCLENNNGTFTCICLASYSGVHCETATDPHQLWGCCGQPMPRPSQLLLLIVVLASQVAYAP